MTRLTRSEAHLLLSGIRVLVHRNELAPTPEELAELLEMPATLVRLQLAALAELGAVALVESAFHTHAEIRRYLAVEDLVETAGPEISEDLKAFDERKKAETEKMAHLFESGESERQRQEQLQRMDQDLKDFKKKKPRNPFGDD